MIGIDHRTASLEQREPFSLAPVRQREVVAGILTHNAIDGAVILSTCNRTELYLAHSRESRPDALRLLCRLLGCEAEAVRPLFRERRERAAAAHLLRVAAGLVSSVPGDDQIAAQIREALENSRQIGGADPLLETLFRAAVAAGKRIKTSVSFVRYGGSAAGEAVLALERELGGLAGKRALVIGNGVVGRLAAAGLRDKGAEVAVTRRTCRHGGPDVPAGCESVDYDQRYRIMDGRNIVVSATTSPHSTVAAAALGELSAVPPFFVDLAIPRDIDPEVTTVPGVTLWNIDKFTRPTDIDANRRQEVAAEAIIEEECRRFTTWRHNRRVLARAREQAPRFPLFIDLNGAEALVVGAGAVAARRAGMLVRFGARVRIVAPVAASETHELIERENIRWERREYNAADLEGVTLAVAATDQREVNRRIGKDARKRRIPVSVADRREECTFYFPALAQAGNLMAGLVSDNGDHQLVAEAAKAIRETLRRFSNEDQNDTDRK